MAKSVALVLLASVLICGSAQAQDEGFGLGLILGEPTGVSGKQWIDSKRAVDGAVAWSFEKEAAMHLHADLLFHTPSSSRTNASRLLFYYGIGGRIKFADESKAGLRVPLGLDYLSSGAPIDIFFEIVPLLDLAPKTDFTLNAAIGIRYFFGRKAHE